MTQPEQAPLFQFFKSQDDFPLAKLSTHLCAESGKRFVYWKDVEAAFESVVYLQDRSDERLLFMIDDNAELHIPLRIEYDPDDEYTVVCNSQRPQSDIYRDQGNSLATTPFHLFDPLEMLYTTTKYLFDRLKLTPNAARATFLQIVANAQHYHALLVNEIQSLDDIGFKARFPSTDRPSVLRQVQRQAERVPDWDYRNVCLNMFYGDHGKWDYATSKLFVVLPSDPDSLDYENPSTHQFRLYFLCDNSMDVLAQRGMPQHVHLSNHPGYILKQPEEFFKKYGDYVLRLLQLVRLGYSDNTYDIPAIETYNVLWKYKVQAGSQLNRDKIIYLIEKAISHIQNVSPSRWIMEPGLTRIQSAAIKDFLEIQHGDNAEGNLHRHIDSQQCVSWKCQRHKEQYFPQKPLEALRAYVGRRQGHIDMQQAKLRVVLHSHTESIEFQRLLTNIRLPFNLSVKLSWNTSRPYVEKFCQEVAQLKTVVLDIDGIPLKSYPQGYVHFTRNIFVDKVRAETGLQLIAVHNYPRPHEQCIHIGNFSLQSRLSPLRSSHSWVELRADLDRFGKLVSNAQVMSEIDAAVTELQLVQEKHGLSDTSRITIHGEKWAAVFDLKELAVIEAYSHDAECPRAVRSSGSLRRFTVDVSDLEFDRQFFEVVDANARLQYLNVAYHGKTIFTYIEHMIELWRESSIPYCLTLIERLEDTTEGRIVAQMTIQRPDSDTLEVDTTSPSTWKCRQGAPAPPADIQFLTWDEDQASIRTDYHAMFLDMVTRQHSSALRLLTMDVSKMSSESIYSLQNVLRQSRLEHLNIVCKPVDPALSQPISEALGAMPWDTLKSLVLTGNDTNRYMELCPTPETSRLLGFQIHGTGSEPEQLGHLSALFIHQMASENPLAKMELKGVQLQDPNDWIVIVDAPDPSYLKKIDLCKNGMSQLQSNTRAADLYESKFKGRIDSAARRPVSKAQSLQDVFMSSTNGIPLKVRDSASHTPVTTSEVLADTRTQYCIRAHVVSSEMSSKARTQITVGVSETIAETVPQRLLEMAGEAEIQEPNSILHILQQIVIQTPTTQPEMADDTETRTSIAKSEMPDQTKTQTPVAPPVMPYLTRVQRPVTPSELLDHTRIHTLDAVPSNEQDDMSQTSVITSETASDTETQSSSTISDISDDTGTPTMADSYEMSGDTEAEAHAATWKKSDEHRTRMLSDMLPTSNIMVVPNIQDSPRNMEKPQDAPLWRQLFCWCG